MNSKCKHGKIKGFTLVELIVVMAIIVILAGIGSLGVTAFVRNARMETCDDNAHLVFTGFQNMLTQCEIKQDSTIFSHDEAKHSDLKAAIVTFEMSGANIQSIKLDSSYADYTSFGGSATGALTGGSMNYSGTLAALANAVMSNIDNTFEGRAKVYIDYDNYEVKSVLYQNLATSNDIDTNISAYQKAVDSATKFEYCVLYERDDRTNLHEGKRANHTYSGSGVTVSSGNNPSSAIQCGAYPYQKELYSVT